MGTSLGHTEWETQKQEIRQLKGKGGPETERETGRLMREGLIEEIQKHREGNQRPREGPARSRGGLGLGALVVALGVLAGGGGLAGAGGRAGAGPEASTRF